MLTIEYPHSRKVVNKTKEGSVRAVCYYERIEAFEGHLDELFFIAALQARRDVWRRRTEFTKTWPTPAEPATYDVYQQATW